jgi:hypothetical protein
MDHLASYNGIRCYDMYGRAFLKVSNLDLGPVTNFLQVRQHCLDDADDISPQEWFLSKAP